MEQNFNSNLIGQNCYRFEKITYNNGLLDKSVDATYILHLEGNGRLEGIRTQLENYQPSKIVYILFNKGFRKCKKNLSKQEPPTDLIDAFLQVFKDADKKNYNNILILEDDFIFNKEMKDSKIIDEINDFIEEKNDKKFMYMLGALPHYQVPYKNNHYKLISSTGTHACIYSKKLRDNMLDNVDFSKISDWDYYTNTHFSRYIYNKPLCYQLFPETDNSKYWYQGFGVVYLLRKYMNFLGLDTKTEPGYSICYFTSKIWIYIILLIILLIWFNLKN